MANNDNQFGSYNYPSKKSSNNSYNSYNVNTNRESNEFKSYNISSDRKDNDYDSYNFPSEKKRNSHKSYNFEKTRKKKTYKSYNAPQIKPNTTFSSYEASGEKSIPDKFNRDRVSLNEKPPLVNSYETDQYKSVSNKFKRKDQSSTDEKVSLKYSYSTDINHKNNATYKNQNNSINSSYGSLLHDNCIYDRSEIEWYDKFNRFGCLDPYNRLNYTKEYLFFTKPDLHIWEPHTTTLNPQLSGYPYFVDLSKRYPYIVHTLQRSAGGGTSRLRKNPFMAILSNSIKNTLDIDDISANDIETATNMFGTKMKYRDHTWASDEDIDFSLEFEDTKYLEIYNLLKAYDQYNRLAQFGIVDPPNLSGAKVSKSGYNYNAYIQDRENIETFGVFKFIVGEDYETLVYWAYLCGCYFKNVPRGTFGDLSSGDTLKYNVQFHAFSVEDSTPEILEDFNTLILDSYGELPGSDFPIYNESRGRVDGNWARIPYISKVTNKTKHESFDGIGGMEYLYKLKWRK